MKFETNYIIFLLTLRFYKIFWNIKKSVIILWNNLKLISKIINFFLMITIFNYFHSIQEWVDSSNSNKLKLKAHFHAKMCQKIKIILIRL